MICNVRNVVRTFALFALFAGACAEPRNDGPTDPNEPSNDPDGAPDPSSPPSDVPSLGTAVTVHLIPQQTAAAVERVSFAVPLQRGQLASAGAVRVLANGVELPAARRALAHYRDGSVRSVQLQVDAPATAESDLEVRLGETPGAGELERVAVEQTLTPADGTQGPRVWAVLPAEWLAASGVAGVMLTQAEAMTQSMSTWSSLCDYDRWDTDAFLPQMSDRAVWLYDRATVFYRGYAQRGDLSPLRSAYREASIYRNGVTGTGSATRISIPTAADDLKYHYTQNLAIHYLLTGDDRFREAAENVAFRVAELWRDPGYAGGDDFWTERNAGFALLAYVWAMTVSDDHAPELQALADAAVRAYAEDQDSYPPNGESDARCFAHTAEAHGEDFGTWGCSPWMSGILADGLDGYAAERGGDEAGLARDAIIKLGTMLARHGRDDDGKPYYWMALDGHGEIDPYDEHWGESAYIVAMAWHYGGRTSAELKTAADELVDGLDEHGEVGQLRSFNWQCRSATATPRFLR
ncbi:MAG: hypothetical protein AB7P03_30890 [Kofleriaceae bacterium]